MRILKDSNGWGERFLEIAAGLPATIPQEIISSQALSALDDRFWVMFMDIYRQILRGDSEKPYPVYLRLLNFTVPTLLALLPTADPASRNLIQTAYGLDAPANAAHLRQLLSAYIDARDAVAKRHDIVFSANKAFERQILSLVNKLSTSD
jgi:hypothetical protein